MQMITNQELEKKEIFLQLLLAIIILAVFSISVHYPLLKGFDDNAYVLSTPHLNLSLPNIIYWFTHPRAGCCIPVTMLSYMLDRLFWGLSSTGYHLQNIFWHIIATIAIFNCFRQFRISSWIAFLICLIFAVHPQRIESVVWISERKDVLCTAFYFWCIYFYIKNNPRQFSILAFSFFLLAILSKPMAVSLPVILLIYEFHAQRKTNPLYYLRKLYPYLLVLIILLPVSILAQGKAIHLNSHIFSFQRLYLVLYNFFWYFTQTFIPFSLNPVYPLRQTQTMGLMAIILFYGGIAAIIIMLIIKNRQSFVFNVAPLILVFIVSLLPVSGLVMLGPTDHADRYSYIPSVFIWFAVAIVLTRQIPFRKFITIILIMYSCVLIFLNYQYQQNWKSTYKLFSYAAKFEPANINALISLAELELNKKNLNRVLEISQRLSKTNKGKIIAVYFKASVLYRCSQYKQAIGLLEKIKHAFKTQSDKNIITEFRYLKILVMLINSYCNIGEKQKAIDNINKLLQCKIINMFAYNYFQGLKAQCQNKYKEAVSCYKKALMIKPNDRTTQNNIKECLKLQKIK